MPAFDELTRWALKRTIVFRDNEELIQYPRVIGLYEKEVEKCPRHLARVEKIKKYKLLSIEWAPHSCELTPTLKIERRIVEEKYREIIDEMY